jgi:hypothetical protein
VGVGDPQLEAAYTLQAAIPAGVWHFVGDGIVFAPVDITWDVIWRPAGGGPETGLVRFAHHYDPGADLNTAVPYEATAVGVPAEAHAGDQLVLRLSAAAASQPNVFYPNGEGSRAHGRIPYLDLPQ